MERLDACFFCGTAADAPLREVSISPRARRGEPDATVRLTLCPSCEDKLERVLGGLFEHVESRRTAGASPGGAADPEADVEVRDEPEGRGGDEEVAASGADEPNRAAEPDPVDRIDVGSRDRARRGRTGRRRLFEGPDLREVPEPSELEGDAAATADAEAAGDQRGGVEEVEEEEEEEGTAEDDAEVIDDEEPRARVRATSGGPPGLDDVSVGEYNRVLRLLQNRRFPIARQAFVDLAASAYDLGEESVQAVLDAVIDRGALAERDGQLVRPGDERP